MLACLESKVDLILCGDRDPQVTYLDRRPGITIQSIDAAASGEQETFRGIMADVKKEASRLIMQDFNLLQDSWSPQILTEGAAGFYPYNHLDAESAPVGWRGVMIQTYSSRYSGLWVGEIQYYARAAGTLNLFVYDASNGLVADSFTFTVVEGYNIFAVGRAYAVSGSLRKLVFVYQSTENEPTLTPLYEGCNCNANCFDDCCGYKCGQYRIAGVKSFNSVPLASTLEETNYSYGLRITFDVRCMFEMLICQNEDLFANAYIELCSALLLEMKYYSDRLNRFVTTGKERAAELIKEYKQNYHNAMGKVKNVQFRGDNCCYHCPAKITDTWNVMGPGRTRPWYE